MEHLSEVQQPGWIVAVCSVLFDIDVGQKMEHLYPPNALSEEEMTDISFHSFPDSLSMELHSVSKVKDSSFFFRVRRRGACTSPVGAASSAAAGESSHYKGQQDQCLYGYAFCRQRQDERLRRGAEQKAVVLLSEFPYTSVLRPLSQYTGPLYFNHGASALEQVYSEVSQWPAPAYGMRAVLPVGALSLPAQVPPPSTLPPPCAADVLDEEGGVPGQGLALESMVGAFHEVDVYSPLRGVLKHLWELWELMLLAEPLMVVAPTPGECSTAMAALISLLTPLPYSADFRPYLTIHDPAFAPMSAGQLPSNSNGLPRLIGVTNLYFVKALPKWPSVLSVGATPARAASAGALSGPGVGGDAGQMGAARSNSGGGRTSLLIGGSKPRHGPISLLSERVDALWTSHKSCTRPNAKVLAFLNERQQRSSAARVANVNSNMLRKHFVSLTSAFLQPFVPFFTPLTDEQLLATPSDMGGGEASFLKPFSRTEFTEALKGTAFPEALRSACSSHGAVLQLYRRFLEGPNFSSWFERRRHAVLQWQQEAWRRLKQQQVMSINTHMDEVALIELFYKLEQRLDSDTNDHKACPTIQSARSVAALKRELSAVYNAMPRDLQQTLLSAPHRAAMVQSLQPTNRVPGMPQRHIASPRESSWDGSGNPASPRLRTATSIGSIGSR